VHPNRSKFRLKCKEVRIRLRGLRKKIRIGRLTGRRGSSQLTSQDPK